MTAEEIYELLYLFLEPLYRGLDPERQVALDGLLDVASRKIAARIETKSRIRADELGDAIDLMAPGL